MRERLRQGGFIALILRVRQRLRRCISESEGWPLGRSAQVLGSMKTELVRICACSRRRLGRADRCRFRRAQSAVAPYEAVIVAAFTHQPPTTLVEAGSRIAG